jgi:hypothetical protein
MEGSDICIKINISQTVLAVEFLDLFVRLPRLDSATARNAQDSPRIEKRSQKNGVKKLWIARKYEHESIKTNRHERSGLAGYSADRIRAEGAAAAETRRHSRAVFARWAILRSNANEPRRP